jgi:hypothetical protein
MVSPGDSPSRVLLIKIEGFRRGTHLCAASPVRLQVGGKSFRSSMVNAVSGPEAHGFPEVCDGHGDRGNEKFYFFRPALPAVAVGARYRQRSENPARIEGFRPGNCALHCC